MGDCAYIGPSEGKPSDKRCQKPTQSALRKQKAQGNGTGFTLTQIAHRILIQYLHRQVAELVVPRPHPRPPPARVLLPAHLQPLRQLLLVPLVVMPPLLLPLPDPAQEQRHSTIKDANNPQHGAEALFPQTT